MLLSGQNPYVAFTRGGPYDFDNIFVYPLPAALVAVPFTWVSVKLGGALFNGFGVGLLAWALTKDGWARWPLLMSFPTLWAVTSGQWSTYVTAAALMPALGCFGACKPTLGAAAWTYKLRWQYIASGLAICLIAFVVMPDWPAQWYHATQRSLVGNYHVPLLVPGGFLVVAALLRWRRPDARLLVAMACVPQSMFPYDQLPLTLLARTRIQSYLFAIWSYLAIWGGWWIGEGRTVVSKVDSLNFLARAIVWGYYLPLVVLVLRRPNDAGLGTRESNRESIDQPSPTT
jgi:hypothetical protein